jgi:hypothetical protein
MATKTPAVREKASTSDPRVGASADALKQAVVDHLPYSLGRLARVAGPRDYYRALAVRNRMQRRWIATKETYFAAEHRVAAYLSAEFLTGPHLGNNLLNLGIEQAARTAMAELGFDLDEVLACEEEPDSATAGLDGSPPAISTPWQPWSVPRSAGASATSSASSTKRSATVGRPRSPTSGCVTATRGRSPNRRWPKP